MYEKIISDLRQNPAKDYDIDDAERLADDILRAGGHDKIKGSTPIVKIADELGFKTFNEEYMPAGISGNIFIGGRPAKTYKTSQGIIVGRNKEFYHQRFIIAHELGHYLMDYLGSDMDNDSGKAFSMAYPKENHDSPKERRADRFAAQLLMPAKAFYRAYIRAVNASDRNERYVMAYLSNYFKVKQSSVQRRIWELIS